MSSSSWRERVGRRVGAIGGAILVLLAAVSIQAAQATTASITVTPGFGPPTSLLKVAGSGFQAAESVDIYFDSTDVGRVTATGSGAFAQTGIYIPTPAAPGQHWITAVGHASAAAVQIPVTVRTDWTQGSFDSSHQGWNIFENGIRSDNVSTLGQVWTGPTGGAVDSSPAVVNGIAYVGSADGKLYAFKASGCGSPPCTPQWTGATGGAVDSSPAVQGGVVYVGSADGKLYAFNAKGCGSSSCAPLWTGSTGGAIHSSPTVAGGLVYVGSADSKLYAFNANGCGGASCSFTWAGATGGPIASSPSVGFVSKLHATAVVVGSGDGKVYAFNSASGAKFWSVITGGPVTSSPAFASNVSKDLEMIYVGSADSKLYALKAWSGGVVWTGQTGGAIDSSPAVAGSRVFVGSDDGRVYAYNANDCGLGVPTCSPLWTAGTVGMAQVNAAPVVADGLVYVGRDDGYLYAYNQAGCQSPTCPNALWTAPTGAPVKAAAAIADGTVFVSSEDGSLHAYRLPTAPVPPPAPAPSSLVPTVSPIKHVVVIYQENHSFDNVLGKLCTEIPTTIVRPGLGMSCDGTTQGTLLGGTPIALTQTPDIVPNVNHSSDAIAAAMNGGAMDGFSGIAGCQLKNNYACYSQYDPSQIPNTTSLAERFVIADRTFATDAAASWGSHVNLAAQTLGGFVGDIPAPTTDYFAGPGWGCDSLASTPFRVGLTTTLVPSCFPKQDGSGPYKPSPVQWVPTIMDNLDQAGLGWRVYEGKQLWSNGDVWSMCPSFAACLYGAQAGNVQAASQLITDAQNGTLPNVAYAMPFPGKGVHAGTSQHNGTSMISGDNQIGADLAALMNGPEWSSTAVFITWDDCGCFYDHVNPLQFNAGYGVRLPMIIVSPYARSGFTDSNVADITSISAFIEHAYGVAPVSSKDAAAYDYANSFDYSQTPLAPARMTRRQLPRREIRWLKAHPQDATDPT